ncbi:WhiB family transcriptional regulator [Amycolatopsis thermoflava]|uniref:WhiB family transcriptional regulator n=1 Tax=Amycolatopsis thermoflava TaxID=84480 RepID=UPI00041C580B|nr:WhiB family transcriptional regulator [Amycolatopsis thermoflava]
MTVVAEPPRLPREVPDWHERGACQLFPELDWIAPGGEKPTPRQRAAAETACRVICAACPVRMLCAEDALRRGEPWGIWGGLDRKDRTAVAREHGFPRPAVVPEHGTNWRYAKWNRTCTECREAHTIYERERRARARRKVEQREVWRQPVALDTPVKVGRRWVGAGQYVLPLDGIPAPRSSTPRQAEAVRHVHRCSSSLRTANLGDNMAESTTAGELILRYIADVIAVNEAADRREHEAIEKLEVEGHRIVTGGQTGGYDEKGTTPFEVRDWRTDQLIFSSRGTLDDFEKLVEERDTEDKWVFIDSIEFDDEAAPLPPAPAGLPASLAQVLGDWATDCDDDARELVGLPPAD